MCKEPHSGQRIASFSPCSLASHSSRNRSARSSWSAGTSRCTPHLCLLTNQNAHNHPSSCASAAKPEDLSCCLIGSALAELGKSATGNLFMSYPQPDSEKNQLPR